MAGESFIRRRARGAVLVVSLARPPVNALDATLMADLSAALREAEADAAVTAVVLAAEGSHFSAGLDASELGRVNGAALPALASLIEGLKKPVVASLQGNVFGGALELALACHARIAHEGARLSLPEISLGLLPVAGSTQRLPRLVGAPVALKMLIGGQPLTAVEALAMGLVDQVTDGPPVGRAEALALALAGATPVKTSDRRDGMRDPLAYQSAIAENRKLVEGGRLPAPMAAVDCVEAAMLLPFDMGLDFEQSRAQTLAETPEAAGLRHAFLAEKRALLLPPELAATAPIMLDAVAILGTDGPAADVARMALGAGLRVRLIASERSELTQALQKIASRQEVLVAEGSLSPTSRDADWARLSGALASDGGGPVDLVLVTPEAPRLAEMPGPAAGLGGRGALVLHPAKAPGGLAPLAIGSNVPPLLQAAALAFGRRLGWKIMAQGPGSALDQRMRLVLARAVAVLEEDGRDRQTIAAILASYGLGAAGRTRLPAPPEGAGPVLDFCLAALMNEGARMVSEGAARRPSDVDAAVLLTGLFPRWQGGPMFQADQIGLMALRADLRQRALRHPQLFSPAPSIERLIAEGRHFADLNRA